jgi:uncharacterized protein YbjQ (UPF0145 family)
MTPIPGVAPDPFTCDLTVDELLLITNAGWEPIAFVSGDCSYNPGHQGSSWTYSKELKWITNGLARGQTLAVERMRAQARLAGGEGVVGVRLATAEITLDGPSNPPATRHFSAVGTAVARRDAPRARPRRPFTSLLSGQDTWALLAAGCAPLGLVFGFSVYHSKTAFKRPRDCSEMTDLTDAVYSARELAMHRMQDQAAKLRADGVVGVSIEMNITRGPTITFTAVGTAITTPKVRPDDFGPRTAIELSD